MALPTSVFPHSTIISLLLAKYQHFEKVKFEQWMQLIVLLVKFLYPFPIAFIKSIIFRDIILIKCLLL